ncbi:polysaccharide deacetylase family protein [Halococcus thailandensis]|uniref:polysaccharide deacetylase family protein n=1 Tax=Halococcus thailandensis TaxID=335952 RepID=UPI0009B5BD85|nr:polysaccharide deacetylase family protein [Halococcus thailandensis]
MEHQNSNPQVRPDNTTQQKRSSLTENTVSHQSTNVKRRRFLAAGIAGVTGLGILGSTSNAAAAGKHTLVIEGTGDRTNYSFTVDGNLSGEDLTSEDDINGSSAHGAVAPGQDVYRFDGSLHAFTYDGASVAVKLDGDWAHVGQRPDYVLTITGTGSYASYAFDVTDNLQPHYGITSEDNISGTHAEGAVRNGTDAYLLNGDLEAFSFKGEIAVKQNGQWAHVGQLPESTSGSDDNNNGTSDLRLGYNARKRSHNKGTAFENFGDFSAGWESREGRVEQNSTDFSDPSDDAGCATLISDGNNDRVEMVNRLDSENFAYRDPSMAVRLRGTSNETLRVELAAGDGSEYQVTTRYLSEKHGWVRIGLGPSTWSGTPDLADINELSISCYTGGKSCEIDIDDIRTTPKRDNGAVLFVFDDGNESDYTVAYDMMSDRGMAGSSAVIPRVVGNSGKLSQSQIDEMDSNGWSWPSHPQRGSPSGGLGSIPADEAEQEMRDNKQWVLDNTSGRGANTLVWPFGDFNEDSMNIAGEYYDLSFGGGASTANGIVTEASWIPRVNTDSVENSLEALEQAYKTETVCVLMAHGLGGSRLPESDFRRLLDKAEQRNLDVLTTAEFAAEQS